MNNAKQTNTASDAVVGCSRIFAFFAFVGVLAFSLHKTIDFGIRGINKSEFGVWNNIVDGRINADILIAGSSRALTHYDSRIIEAITNKRTYNIGLNGSQTDMQNARIKTYLEHNKKPLLIIFNLDLFSFQVTQGGVYNPGQYIPYLNQRPLYHALKQIDPEIWKSRYIPLYGYAVEDLRLIWTFGLLSLLSSPKSEDHFQGFKPRYTKWSEDFARFKKNNPKGVRFGIETQGINEMEKLMNLCKNNKIPILLVYSPEYVEMQKITRNRKEIFKLFLELSNRFSTQLWDYSGSRISAKRINFYNSQHLNNIGANLFSLKVATRLRNELQNLLRVHLGH